MIALAEVFARYVVALRLRAAISGAEVLPARCVFAWVADEIEERLRKPEAREPDESPAFIAYAVLAEHLRAMLAAGKDDADADTLRERMDRLWPLLTDGEVERLRQLAAEGNASEEEPVPESEVKLREVRDPESGKLLARVDDARGRVELRPYRRRCVWVDKEEICGPVDREAETG